MSREEQPVDLPIDGVLDLHTFSAADVRALVPAYLEACRERRIWEVRIIHGKGVGVLRRIVAGILSRHPLVASFGFADERDGGWGATIVQLARE